MDGHPFENLSAKESECNKPLTLIPFEPLSLYYQIFIVLSINCL